MSRYSEQIKDNYGRPVSGAQVYVYTDVGDLAELSDDTALPLDNPLTTDQFGEFYFNAADGDYQLEVRYLGRLVHKEDIRVGPFPAGAQGPPGDVSSAADRTALAAISSPAGGSTVYLKEAGREGTFVFSGIITNLSAEVAADPRQGFYVPPTGQDGSAGAWVRRTSGRVAYHDWFGAQDCTGTPKESSEAVFDNSDALEGMYSIIKFLALSRNKLFVMDWSGALGLGISRQLTLDTTDYGATWNAVTLLFRPGRLVAMAYLDSMIHFKGHNFFVFGRGELYGGVDARLTAYGDMYAKHGITIEDAGGSSFGDWFVMGVRRYPVNYSTLSGNNIPTSIGDVYAIQCGACYSSAVNFSGSYTGTWTNQPADNGNSVQRHRMTLTPNSGDPTDLEVGDLIDFNGRASVGKVKAIVSTTSTTVTVDIYPWQPVQSGGTFESMHGGGVRIKGGNTANLTINRIETLSAGTGLQLGCLYGPKINTYLSEATRCCVSLGIDGGESMEGIRISHYHFESVTWSFVDDAFCSGARFGTPSNLEGSARGKFGKAIRLVPQNVVAGVFTPAAPSTLYGVSFEMNGGIVDSPASITRAVGSIGATTLGNAPEYHGLGALFGCNSFTFHLKADKSLADCVSTGKVAPFGPIYGTGPDGAPTGDIAFDIDASQTGATVEGGTTYAIKPGIGGIMGIAVYEPPASGDNGNWGICAWRVNKSGKPIKGIVLTESTTARTASLADAEAYVRFTNGSVSAFTIPPNSSVAFPIGTVIEMEQSGAGALSVATGAGVTINSRGADLTLAGQYAVAAVKKVATDTWTLTGDL